MAVQETMLEEIIGKIEALLPELKKRNYPQVVVSFEALLPELKKRNNLGFQIVKDDEDAKG